VLWRHEDFYFNVITSINEPLATPEEIVRYSKNPNGMRSLTLSPLMHGGGQFAVLISIFSGGCAAIPVSRSLNPAEVLSIIARHGITMLSIIGDAMARPVAEEKIDSGVDTRSLAIISSGGAIMTEAGRALLLRAFGSHIYITGGIGGSEIGAAAMEGGSFDALSGPRFRPFKNMAVLDDKLNPLSPGMGDIGMLAVTGHIPLGYYKDTQKTASTFVTDARGQRWALPGDYARVEDDGSFSLIGRSSQCINSGGEKIFVEEVERAVASHPAIRLCAVVGIADEKWQQRVAVVVELQPGVVDVSLKEIQDTCRHFIAGYKIPRELCIATFKLTDNGKIDYVWARNLAELANSRSRQTIQRTI
jgi:fatty-acyl-CoA synthase